MRKKLGDTLVAWGALMPSDLESALALQSSESRATRRRLGRVLLDQGLLTEATLASALADMHGVPAVDLGDEVIDAAMARRIPQSTELQYLVMPLSMRDDVMRVAVADPLDVVALDDMRMRMAGVRIEIVVAAESQLRDQIVGVWRDARSREVMRSFVANLPTEIKTDPNVSLSDEGAVAAVRQILEAAARLRASDIHLEPMRDAMQVRFRIDGQLRDTMTLPKSGQATMIARMKIISGLDIVERRLPQDGRARIRVDGRDRNLRVSTLPTIHGEKVVIRLLADNRDLPTLSGLGMPEDHVQTLRAALRTQQGLLLVTGPTGAGKTTTLYSAIREVLDNARNLITLEDPVEVELPGVAQVQVNDRIGMTFAAGLRSALRQDPDVIMVGEIRDRETAELAVRAALTGHLVVSTLHTLDAASAVTRLVEMGVPNYLVASAISLSMAQRLVRRPCQACLRPEMVNADTRARLGIDERTARKFVFGAGCVECEGVGYLGRTGIYELLSITPEVRVNLIRGVDAAGLAKIAAEHGWKSLLQAGVDCAVRGNTTAAEILRVLSSGATQLR